MIFTNPRYLVIKKPSPEDLSKAVEALMSDGWKLQGGVSCYIDKIGHPHFRQAMVK